MVAAVVPESGMFSLSEFQKYVAWSEARFVVAIAGRNGGKTTAFVLKLFGMIHRGEIPNGARILVMAPSYPQMRMGTIKTFDKWFDQTGYVYKKIDGNEPERRLANNIIVYFRNASNPEQTRSHEVCLVWLDEAGQMKDDVLPLTSAALRQFGPNFNYQTWISTTPRGKNWIFKLFAPQSEKRGFADSQIAFFHTTTLEAEKEGVVRPGYVDEMGYIPGTAMYEQEVLGNFVAFSGLVFDFDENKHCPYPFVLPTFKKVVGGIDVGVSSPTAMILIGEDEAGRVWAFKEYYQPRASFHEWVRIAAEWTKEYKVRTWYVDSAANIELATMKSAGLPARPSIKTKDAAGTAVNYVNSLLKRDMFRLDKEACPMLKMELESYEFKELQSGDEVTFLDKVKNNQPDHALDALRYASVGLSGQRSTQSAGQWLAPSFGGR